MSKSCNFASPLLAQVAQIELHNAINLMAMNNQTEFCRQLGISRSALINYLNQRKDLKPWLAREIERRTNGKIKAVRLLGLAAK